MAHTSYMQPTTQIRESTSAEHRTTFEEFSKYKERRAEKQVPFQPGRGFLIPQR